MNEKELKKCAKRLEIVQKDKTSYKESGLKDLSPKNITFPRTLKSIIKG